MSTNGRFALVFNGAIYNFRSLRCALEAEGWRFATRSDTEVLVVGYEAWGRTLFARLDGMFAVALYDTLHNRLVLARDRVGEKPLYIGRVGVRRVVFASELKALLADPELSREISEASLFEYFALRYVVDPHTIFSSIRTVQPGTIQEVSMTGEMTEHSFFAFDIRTDPPLSADEALASVRVALTTSVEERLAADVPVAAFLSGGIDSSLICAIAAKQVRKELLCFSAGFEGSDSETVRARKVADACGLPFSEYHVSTADVLSTATRMGELLDHPNGDRSCVPTYVLSRVIRQHAVVALSGDGGDELFGGYPRYVRFPQSSCDPGGEADHLGSYFSRALGVFPLELLRHALPDALLSFQRRVLSRFTPAFARRDISEAQKLRLVDFHTYLPGAVLAKVDRMSMQHGLEVRSPFLSTALLSLSSRLGDESCFAGGLQKIALRRLWADYLPLDLIAEEKRGFGMPESFVRANREAFAALADRADETLASWEPLQCRGHTFDTLKRASRQNVNSYWAWIVLGQWVATI